ncbi:uncharacterized protein BJ212DRAFT_1483075 [Suillus subaureus]|uniref:Uncharacterized protein n=1 Tax=Suillus subaureus TaxID=48587 RepID=A0A9P7JBA1_9AGAM|nr:uncharacterized protein BJ212DRAFT_1483075 [Suillus subaureus]KAG1812441.1 hypothetical protein BJ212DRAFT_1483075 [Suillus subaureus]
MSSAFVRNLYFQTKDLGKEVTLLLTFDSDVKGIYQTCFPAICWLTTFGQTGSYRMHANYTSQLAFSRPQVTDGNIIEAETCMEINVGDSHLLCEHSIERRHFSIPVKGVSGYLEFRNDTGSVQDIALGFMSPRDLMPRPILYFKEIEHASNITIKFTSILRAYITSDYKHTAILQGAIDTPAIWEQNLAALSESTTWDLKRDPSTGHYKITQADQGMSNSSTQLTVVGGLYLRFLPVFALSLSAVPTA